MKTTTSEQLATAERLHRERQYAEALEVLAAIDLSSLARREQGYWHILYADANLCLGSCDVQDSLLEALSVFRHDADTEKFARAKYLLGLMQSSEGEYASAAETLLEAWVHFDRCGNKLESARALNRLAYVQSRVGSLASASENLLKCSHIYASAKKERNRTETVVNLCYLYFMAGRLDQSLSSYADIDAEISALGERSSAIYYEMSAIPQALLGDIKTARKTIAKAKPFLDSYPRERAIYYENLGLINLIDGKYAVAEKELKRGLKLSLEIAPESALVSQIKRLFGDLYVATEEWDKAEQFTNEALEVAEMIGQRVEIAACYRIFAQIAVHDGDADRGREWFTKAIELFQLIGSNYELAVTRYLAGVSGLYESGERQALLWMARQYFESEQVKPYLKKIDKALALSTALPIAQKGGLPPVVIGKSKVMTNIITMAERVAPSNMNVFLTGATGTGKDLLAKYIHHHSGCDGEFVSVNAAAIPGPMIESELFGHKKGSFTGSEADRAGLLEQATDGTFYLNEIADATMEFQAKLLEVLETREVRRVGDDKARPVSFRLIAATNHDLKQRIGEGKFRLDLYHRLNEIPIELPPLSDRTEDIPHLVEFFLTNTSNGYKSNGNREALDRLAFLLSVPDYDGNIRELKNRVKALQHTSHDDIERMIELLMDDGFLSEHEWLTRILHRTSWNRREAARMLGVSETTVRNRIAKFDLAPVS